MHHALEVRLAPFPALAPLEPPEAARLGDWRVETGERAIHFIDRAGRIARSIQVTPRGEVASLAGGDALSIPIARRRSVILGRVEDRLVVVGVIDGLATFPVAPGRLAATGLGAIEIAGLEAAMLTAPELQADTLARESLPSIPLSDGALAAIGALGLGEREVRVLLLEGRDEPGLDAIAARFCRGSLEGALAMPDAVAERVRAQGGATGQLDVDSIEEARCGARADLLVIRLAAQVSLASAVASIEEELEDGDMMIVVAREPGERRPPLRAGGGATRRSPAGGRDLAGEPVVHGVDAPDLWLRLDAGTEALVQVGLTSER